jgi:hypothetical protein
MAPFGRRSLLLPLLSALACVLVVSFALFALVRLAHLGLAGEWSQLFEGVREFITASGCFATLFLVSHRGICEIIGWILVAFPLIGYPLVVIQSLRAKYKTQ